MKTIANLHLQKIIFEEIERFLEQNPEKVQQTLRRNIEKHQRAYVFLEKLLGKLNDVRDINKSTKEEFANMARVLTRANTPVFFHQVLKAPADKINAVNKVFGVIKNIEKVEMSGAQTRIRVAKAALEDLIDFADEKMDQTKKAGHDDTRDNDVTHDRRVTRGDQTTVDQVTRSRRVAEGQSGSSLDRELNLAKQEINGLKQYLSSHLHNLLNTGSDENSKSIVQKEAGALTNALDSFSSAVEQHVGSEVAPDPEPVSPEPAQDEQDPPSLVEQEKHSQDEAAYTPVSNMVDQDCRSCIYYTRENNSCQIVDGQVRPRGWCKFWKSGDELQEIFGRKPKTPQQMIRKLNKQARKWQLLSSKYRDAGRKEATEMALEKVRDLLRQIQVIKKKHGIPNIPGLNENESA